jgi:hypothetical protein
MRPQTGRFSNRWCVEFARTIRSADTKQGAPGLSGTRVKIGQYIVAKGVSSRDYTISTLWMEGPLSFLEQLCPKSVLREKQRPEMIWVFDALLQRHDKLTGVKYRLEVNP